MTTQNSEALASGLMSEINPSIKRLVEIWNGVGITEDGMGARMKTVHKHIRDLLRQMVVEEEAMEARLNSDVRTLTDQLGSLGTELGVDPVTLEEGLTKLQREKLLRGKVEELQGVKAERLRQLQGLRREDEALCDELCLTPFYIPTGSTPSLTELDSLRKHIASLSQEKAQRLAVVTELRRDISRLMKELGHEPETSLERDSHSNDTDSCLLTKENISALTTLRGQLGEKRDSLAKMVEELRDKAQALWRRLSCAEEEVRAFQESVTGTLNNQIAQWRTEVENRAEQQKTKLGEVTEKVRQELVAMWEVCQYSAEQKEAFNQHFCDSSFTEQLLFLHDAELEQVRAYYSRAKPLLDVLQQWEKNFALFQDFEKRANDPSRFSNRGGALLKETKERTKVQKTLPKLEDSLCSAAKQWLADNGTDFLVRGQKVNDYLSYQWEEYKEQKNKEKQEKNVKKVETNAFKTPTKRPNVGTAGSTPAKLRKNTVQRSNSTSCSVSSTFIVPDAPKPLMSASKVQQKSKVTAGTGNDARVPLHELTGDKQLPLGSYSDFMNELSRKANDSIFNSTVKDCL